MKLITCLLLLLTSFLTARTWTDRTGRSIEAEFVRINGDAVIVKRDDKEISIKRAALCDIDVKFIEQLKSGDSNDSDPNGGAQNSVGASKLNGNVIEKGGKMNLIEKEYSAESLKDISKQRGKKGTTGDSSPDSKKENDGSEKSLKLAVAMPSDCDPNRPLNVFIVITAVNNEAERAGGNIAKFKQYAKSCVANGWVCIAIDSNSGVPHSFVTYQEAFALMVRDWPGFATSRFSAGGFSGGSKGCWGPIAWLLKNKYQTVGVYMGGCNEDYSARFRDEVGAPSSGYRKIRAFVSTGKADKIATPAQSEGVVKSMKSNGVKDIRYELHDGGHSMSPPHFVEALKWFALPGI